MTRIGTNIQAKTAWPEGLDVLYVLDDWNTSPPPGAALYRTMAHDGYTHLPAGSDVVAGNEDDEEQDGLTLESEPASVQQQYQQQYGANADAMWLRDHRIALRRQWRPQFAQAAKAAGMRVHCAAEKWFERYQYDPEYIDMCDVVDIHIAAFEVVGKTQQEQVAWWEGILQLARGKPVCVTEVETDPAYEETQLPTIPEAMRICLALGAEMVFAWGDNPGYANVIDYPDILEAIRQLKANPPSQIPLQGAPSVADEQTQDAEIASEMDRETHLAYAAYAMAKMLDKLPLNMVDTELQTEYHEHINALDPSHLTF